MNGGPKHMKGYLSTLRLIQKKQDQEARGMWLLKLVWREEEFV